MDLRQTINQHPRVLAGASALVVVLMLGVVLAQWLGGRGPGGRSSTGPQAWYTIDDGRTWFADAAGRVVPFEHDGKQAVRCYVWTTDGGKTKFVSHLERLNPAARKTYAGKDRVDPFELVPGSQEVKAPLSGDTGWVDSRLPQAQALQMPKAAGGTPEPVWP